VSETPAGEQGRAATAASRWLPEEATDGAVPAQQGAERDWLLPEAPMPRPEPARDHMPAELSRRVQRLESKLDAEVEATHGAVGRELHALSREIEALSARVDALEGAAAPDAGEERPTRTPRSRSINEISFEELRELGLTVNLASRLISQREVRGGFSSLDELDELWGFPRQEIAELKRAFAS